MLHPCCAASTTRLAQCTAPVRGSTGTSKLVWRKANGWSPLQMRKRLLKLTLPPCSPGPGVKTGRNIEIRIGDCNCGTTSAPVLYDTRYGYRTVALRTNHIHTYNTTTHIYNRYTKGKNRPTGQGVSSSPRLHDNIKMTRLNRYVCMMYDTVQYRYHTVALP